MISSGNLMDENNNFLLGIKFKCYDKSKIPRPMSQ